MVRYAIFSMVLIACRRAGTCSTAQFDEFRLPRPRHRSRQVLRQVPTLRWLQ